MRVAFMVAELGRSGGMAVIRDWARRLDAVLVVCGPGPVPDEDAGVAVRAVDAVGDEVLDVAVATWWTTAAYLWDVPARRRAVLLQSEEQRYYRDDEPADRLGAGAVLDLPVHYLAIAPHLARLPPHGEVRLVAPGIDKAIFAAAPPRPADGPLRVLVEGQPSMWFKGIAEAVAAVRRMREPASVTVVAADPSAARDVGADRVCGGLTPHAMAALYAEHDVLLKLSRLEGRPLPVLEALHVGRPCVTTPLPGLDGVVEHGVSGLLVGFDDEPGTVAALDRLAGSPELRARLREGALATAARWPSLEDAAREVSAALDAILAAPPLDDAGGPGRGLRRTVEAVRIEEWRRRAAQAAAAQWHEAWREADERNAEYDRWARSLRARIDELQRRPAFRVEERLRRLARRGR
jgi:glycosyltransferase involved in cell wall biosynthesis